MDIIQIYALEVSQGNPGALLFFGEAMQKGPNFQKANSGFNRMLQNNIKGSKLFMLWNDCLNRDTEKAVYVMLHDNIESIKDHINFEGGKGIPYENNEPKPYFKEMNGEWWIFTFCNDGSEKAGKCVKIKGSYGEAREKMFDKYGEYFAFQYSEAEWEKNWNNPNREYQMEDIIEVIK